MKEQLVDQLKTQITDLERFIQYLHADQAVPDPKKCGCPKSKDGKNFTHSDIGHEEEVNIQSTLICDYVSSSIQSHDAFYDLLFLV